MVYRGCGHCLKKSVIAVFLVAFLAPGLYAEVYRSNSKGPEIQSPQQGAQEGGPGEAEGQGMNAPPQASIDACSGKSEGDACQCQGPGGNGPGVCGYTPDKKYFICRPNSPPQGREDNNHGQPGQEGKKSPPAVE